MKRVVIIPDSEGYEGGLHYEVGGMIRITGRKMKVTAVTKVAEGWRIEAED